MLNFLVFLILSTIFKNMNEYFIYLLLRNGEPFYVGRTQNPRQRHLRHSFKRPGGKIEMFLLEVYAPAELEIYWIHQLRAWGFDLENKVNYYKPEPKEPRRRRPRAPETPRDPWAGWFANWIQKHEQTKD